VRTSLQSLIPEAADVLRCDSPELAYNILTCLLTLNEGELHLYNLQNEKFFTNGYPVQLQKDIDSAVSGAWSWLLGQGFLGQRPGSNESSWVIITPQGKRWHDQQSELKRPPEPTPSPEDATPHKDLSPSKFGMEWYQGRPLDDELFSFLGQLLVWEINRERDFDFTFSSILAIYLYSDDPISLKEDVLEGLLSILDAEDPAGPGSFASWRFSHLPKVPEC